MFSPCREIWNLPGMSDPAARIVTSKLRTIGEMSADGEFERTSRDLLAHIDSGQPSDGRPDLRSGTTVVGALG
jgi:hypothetical protein